MFQTQSRFTSWAATIAAAVIAFTLLLATGCSDIRDATQSQYDDSPLSLAVYKALKADPQLMHEPISITTTKPGTVRLNGHVNSDLHVTLAEQVALQVDGVRLVTNTLYVR
ncbi:MAG: BON domain-containing protein [Granulosicoccus sp.]